MKEEADKQDLNSDERIGGIIFDEIAIQEDLTCCSHQETGPYLSGTVDMGTHANRLYSQRTGNSNNAFLLCMMNLNCPSTRLN